MHGEFPGETHLDVLKNARKRMLGASPKYFADPDLDYVQVHHGLADNLCRPVHTTDLIGIIGGNSEIHLYPNVGHGIGLDDWDNSTPSKKYRYSVADWYDAVIGGY